MAKTKKKTVANLRAAEVCDERKQDMTPPMEDLC